MVTTFSGLYTASRGLYVSLAAEAVTTNNISNVNTTGYSRKTVSQTAVGPAAVYVKSTDTGSGAEVTSISRTRSKLLDQKYWQESSVNGEWSTKSSYLTQVEEALGATDTDGYSSIMSAFNSSLEDLSTDPSSADARTALQQAGVALCDYLNSMATSLSELRDDVNADVKTTVEQINSCSTQIAALNEQIQRVAAAGGDSSDLEDQRGVLLDQLSALVSIDVSETTVATSVNGDKVTTLTISIAGGTLVSGNTARTLECNQITGSSDSSQNGMYEVLWSDTQKTVTTGDGQLGALLELRDGTGTNSEYKGILYYMNQLDEFAQTFAEAFNEGTASYSGHADGYGTDDSTGVRFFSYDETASPDSTATTTDLTTFYSNITAANISLSSDVLNDVAKIAAASTADEAENGENVSDLISLCASTEMFGGASAEDAINSIVATLGTSSSYAATQAERHDSILSTIDSLRSSISGVSSNEEATKLVTYQQAYAASAKAVSMWQEIYDTMLGMVNS